MTVMLAEALRITSGPVALRWPTTVARHVMPGAVGTGRNARRVHTGDDVCILALGKMVEAAEEAAELLDARDVRATVWDIRTIPADPKMLADARRHPLVVTAEDGIADGGVGALLAAGIGALDTGTPAPPVVALGTPSAFIPHGKAAALLANLGLDGPGIAATVAKLLDDA
jgi:1-deoxy-D-xylulose-5-phosphate synthase